MKFIIALLLFCNISFTQNYEYNEVFVRDFKGDFNVISKSGKFEISDTKIYLFDQEIDVKSKHIIFDEKGIKMGFMYSCSDGKFWFTLLITNANILYFKDKEKELFRLKLTQINK